MRDPEELWTILDKAYKKSVREARKQEKLHPDYIYPGLGQTLKINRFSLFIYPEYIFLREKLENAICTSETYNHTGQKDTEGLWLFPPKDVNSRYKWIKKQKELSKQLNPKDNGRN